VLPEIKSYKPRVLNTSLSDEAEAKLRAAPSKVVRQQSGHVDAAVVKGDRHEGKSKSGFRRLTTHALDGIMAFSDLPLKVSSVLGAPIAGVSLIYGLARIMRATFSASTC
jgi:hypothetical protein